MSIPELTRISPAETESLYEGEYFLPAVRVDNEVEWVNPNVELPFSLVADSPSEVAVMVLPDNSPLQADSIVLGISGHGRSVQIARQQFYDVRGTSYRDIDSKGSGYVQWNPEKSEPGGPERGLVGIGFDEDNRGDDRSNLLGLLDINAARRDQAFGEIFSEGGVRVALPLAVIRLKEIIDKGGNKISIDEARQRRVLPEDFDPAIELRAFGTRHRINNWGYLSQRVSREALSDAMNLVADEIGLDKEKLTARDYLIWFAKTYGEQMRKIHEMGFAHAGLHSQNLTLDCRLVDFDTVHSIAGDYDKRSQVIEGEGLSGWILVGELRRAVADYYPELKKNDDESEKQLSGLTKANPPILKRYDEYLDELDLEIKVAYERGYGEVS